jgi:hypothetical protein
MEGAFKSAPTLLVDEEGIFFDGKQLVKGTELDRTAAFRQLNRRLVRTQAAKPGRLLLLRASPTMPMKIVNRAQAAAWAAGYVSIGFAAEQP